MTNPLKKLYALFSDKQISDKIAQIVKPDNIDIEVEVLYQTLDGLHKSCPSAKGDWYFSGDYPTPGGNKVVNKAFINYFTGSDDRPY